ncbi:hypothetical protein N9N67_04225, partial [Bacteriovoracaceae bacterium]|nr:hypothetical protein [Bacteriovoracaceae bacterium]
LSIPILFLFISCGHRKDAKHLLKLLEAETGQDHSIAKLWTETGEYVVYENEVTGEYSAYNLEKLDRDLMVAYADFSSIAIEGTDIVRNLEKFTEWVESGYWESVYETEYYYYEYWDDWCECWVEDYYTETWYVGEVYVDTSHWYTYYTGGGFRFSNTQDVSKDLETLAAFKQDIAKKVISTSLKNSLQLSVGRADRIAGLVQKYNALENQRELTGDEKDTFAKKALGVSFKDIEGALKKKNKGTEESYKVLLERAAKFNKTTPELMGKFLTEYDLSDL